MYDSQMGRDPKVGAIGEPAQEDSQMEALCNGCLDCGLLGCWMVFQGHWRGLRGRCRRIIPMMSREITAQEAEAVRLALSYDPEAGEFRWIWRGDVPVNVNRRFAGKVAGAMNTLGYRVIRFRDWLGVLGRRIRCRAIQLIRILRESLPLPLLLGCRL